jgi:hypothetical protein
MRKAAIILLLISVTVLPVAAEKSWRLELAMTGMIPNDAGFRNVYGQTLLAPRLELGYTLTADLGIWAGFSLLSKDGTGPLSELPSRSTQQYLSLGVFYLVEISDRLALRLAAGPMLGWYKEEAGGFSASGSAIGFDANAALDWSLSGAFNIAVLLGYESVSATNDEFASNFTLGGIWAGIGVAMRF